MVAFLAQITKKKSRKAPGNSNNLLQEALKTEEIQEVGGLYCSSKCLPGLPRRTAASSPREPNRIKKQSGDSGDEAKGYGACSRASRGPFLRLPATVFPPSPRRCVAGSPAGALGRGTVAADADAEDEQGSARLIGIRVVLWSRGVGESEARLRLSFFSPFLSLFFATAGQ